MQGETLLRKIGLTEGEIRVYLSLMDIGNTTVGAIIDKSRISSSKVYIILEKLIHKGLASYIMKEKTRYYQATSPSRLIDYIEKEESELHQTKIEMNKLVDKLNQRKLRNRQKEDATIYRGLNGLKSAWKEAINSIPIGSTYYFFSFGYGSDPLLQQFFKNTALELKEKQIKIRGIANMKEKRLYNKYYSSLGYKMKYVNLQLPSDISIIGDYVITLVWDKDEPVVYMIKSNVLADSYKLFLEDLWKQAKT
jgi:HTH-type transcriptional regulator, sugar sensing transcriptional regulator